MINVKELRIGNLIEYHVTDNVDGTDEWVDNYVDYDDIGWLSEEENDPCYRPKVLTEDLLVRMGFECTYKSNIHSCYSIARGTLTYYFWYADHRKYVSIQGTTFICNHVHQLQNLYFALTGEEVTIKEVNE